MSSREIESGQAGNSFRDSNFKNLMSLGYGCEKKTHKKRGWESKNDALKPHT